MESRRPSSRRRPIVRPAEVGDLPQISDLYAYYVRETTVTFDVDAPSPDEQVSWFNAHGVEGRWRLFVAEADGGVFGWTSSSRLRPRRAYDTSVETSVYVSPDMTGRGIGTALYETLFQTLAGEDVHRAYAVMSLPNAASVALHERFGFARAGLFSAQGRKFGRYWDVAWYEKRLS
jgi:phosphinothricin acetyltransferase